MTATTEQLIDEWIGRFGEPPILADAELMRALLAEHPASAEQPL